MTFAEDKTFQYIRYHYRNFDRIHVLEILPHLSCLTPSDQVSQGMSGNQSGGRAVESRASSKPEPTPSFHLVCIPLPALVASLTFRIVVQGSLSNFPELPLVSF